MKKIKVLMVVSYMEAGGLENQIMHFIRNADKDKYIVDYTSVTKNAFYKDEIESLGGKYILIPCWSARGSLAYAKALYKIIKNGKYDVVHVHEGFHCGIILAIAKLAGAKCRVAHSHSSNIGNSPDEKNSVPKRIYYFLMRKLINRTSTDQIGCSTPAGEFLFGKAQLTKQGYHLVYNSVDVSKYIENYNSAEHGEFCDDFINVLNIARIQRLKNHHFLIEIAKELKKRNSKIRILCAGGIVGGNDGLFDELNQLIEENDLSDYFKLIGIRNDIDVLLRKSSAFILPTKYEGMPLVVIEAQASGIPCLCADTFSHEVDFGIDLIEWKSLEDGAQKWADSLEAAVSKPRAEKADVVAAIDKGGFDAKNFTSRLCEIYESTLSKG